MQEILKQNKRNKNKNPNQQTKKAQNTTPEEPNIKIKLQTNWQLK